MSAGMIQSRIEDFVRYRLDAKHHVRAPGSKLPALILLEFINETQQEISRMCCLIKTCYHWVVEVGRASYGLELTPSLFVAPYSKRVPLFWKGKSLLWRDQIVLQQNQTDYATNGTPVYGCMETRGKGKAIMLLPAPNKDEGDGTPANDPLHFFAWRIAKAIESTGGIPEIDGDLHDLLKLGTLARAAEHLEDPRADRWFAQYLNGPRGLTALSVPRGIRRPFKVRIANIFANARLGEWSWDGSYEKGV